HAINLFDMHQKYADVVSLAEALEYLHAWRTRQAWEGPNGPKSGLPTTRFPRRHSRAKGLTARNRAIPTTRLPRRHRGRAASDCRASSPSRPVEVSLTRGPLPL